MKTEVTSRVDRGYVSQEAMGAMQEKLDENFFRLAALMAPKWYRIDRFLEKIGGSFTPNKQLTIADLVHASNLLMTRRVLGNTVRSIAVQVNDDTTMFSWVPNYRYAPKTLIHQVESTTPIYYSSSGRLLDPFNWTSCYSSFIENHYGFSMNTDQVVNLAPITFTPILEDGIECAYCVKPCSAKKANGYLVRAAWGGSTSSLLGMPIEETEAIKSIVYHERIASKKGGEGKDFYILAKSFEGAFEGADSTFMNEVMSLEDHICTMHVASAKHFGERLELVRQLEDNSTITREVFKDYDTKIRDLLLPCWQHPVAKLPFVKVPTISEPQFPELPKDLFLCELEEIYNTINHFDPQRMMEYNLKEARRITARWLDFAPAYASLINNIQTLSGTMIIDGEQAIIKVPNRYAPGEIDTIVGLFEATQFSVVKSGLKDRVDDSDKAFRAVLKAKKEFEASNY